MTRIQTSSPSPVINVSRGSTIPGACACRASRTAPISACQRGKYSALTPHVDTGSPPALGGSSLGRLTLAAGVEAEEGFHEVVQVAVEHRLDVAHLETGAMVLDEGVRMEHIAADLAAPLVRLVRALQLLPLLGPLLLA